MKRPQFVFRPTLSNPDHRKAWERLQEIPKGQRKDFLVRAILAEMETEQLKKEIRQVLREELTSREGKTGNYIPAAEKEVPKQTLDFLASLCD